MSSPSSTEGPVRYEVRDVGSAPVAVVTIDRPQRRNALDVDTCRLLSELLSRAAGEARAVVLTGAGGHFCSGADLSTVRDAEFVPILRSVLDALVGMPLACIAAVDGAALGAGTQLAVACDLRVVTPGARFGVPAAKLGIMVDHWTVQRLALTAGHSAARAMLVAAEQVTGEAAVGLGMAHRLGGLEEALAWAGEIGALAPLSVAGHKLALNRLEQRLGDADVAAAHRRAWASADLAEGMAAFSERRAPRFQGR